MHDLIPFDGMLLKSDKGRFEGNIMKIWFYISFIRLYEIVWCYRSLLSPILILHLPKHSSSVYYSDISLYNRLLYSAEGNHLMK